MRLRLKVLLPLALVLGSAASAQANDADSVFATGQVWQVKWSTGEVSTLTVPDLTNTYHQTFDYDENDYDAKKTVEFMHYLKNDSRAESISVILYDNDTLTSQVCIYAAPASISINQSVTGLDRVDGIDTNAINAYTSSNDLTGLPTCTLTRLK